MPFIRGRYHINPVAGEALEAAREAEAALLALEHAARASEDGDDADASPTQSTSAKGPVHRIEIEAAQVVPAHSGRASRGFVARVHRTVAPAAGSQANSNDQADGFAEDPSTPCRAASNSGSPDDDWTQSRSSRTASASSGAPESHVFADHHDLVDFLRDLLASDCRR